MKYEAVEDHNKKFKPNHKCKHGHLQHLSELCKLESTDTNPFVEFEKWFLKYHESCLLTKWFWNRKGDSPYVYVQPLGVFTNLNKLAKRIKNEIDSTLENKYNSYNKTNINFCPTVIMMMGETLSIHLEADSEDYLVELHVNYITLDDVDERRGYEGWKFELNK